VDLSDRLVRRSRAMSVPDRAYLEHIAAECVALVASQFGRNLDWSLASLEELDAVCSDLLADSPLSGQRLDLWWRLIGAYTGEVLVRVHAGHWVTHERAPGSFAVAVAGTTAFPFAVADKVLRAEPYKSLASFARVLPAIVARIGDSHYPSLRSPG
jgi:hypothetical protein